ncbi:MAG: hypothetical protein P4N59_19975 [Negativicutes bacterium]|nr:hypothetical protein [Negativicutes bacterium]
MSALLWFTLLAVIGITVAAFAIYKKRHLTELSTWLVFYLFVTGVTWLGEFTVLGLFDSYAYKPGVFESPWAENLAGHLILNSTLWPGAAMAVVAFRLGYGWMAVITAAFLLMEYLFLKAGLYEQHWWRYYMTAAAVMLSLVISKKWFPFMDKTRHGLPRFVTLSLAAIFIIHLPIPLLLLYGKQYYYVDFALDMYRSSTIFILFYHVVEAAVVMAFFFLGKWYWKLAPYVISFGCQIFLASRGILIIQYGWSLTYTLLIYVVTLTLCLLMEKYTLRPPASGGR